MENEYSLAFRNGVVLEKYVSKNHHYLSVVVQSVETGKVYLEGYDKETWESIKVGDAVSKEMGSLDLIKVQ